MSSACEVTVSPLVYKVVEMEFLLLVLMVLPVLFSPLRTV
jgi:hypothetical protein